MANYRQIHVSIWKDSWFLDLQPDEKLLFIYLFSNESTSLSGMYRLSPKVICFETGITQARLSEILAMFEAAGKVYHEGDVIWMVNMRKFHETKSWKVQLRIQDDLAAIPDCETKRKYITYHTANIPYGYGIDTSPQLKEEEEEDKEEDEDKGYSPATPFRLLLDTFLDASGCKETLLSPPRVADEVRKWLSAGVTEEEIRTAVAELQNKNFSISGPWSITNSINIVKGKNNHKPERRFSEVWE